VTEEQIREAGGAVETFKAAGELTEEPREALPSPGVGLRHYAPRARLVLVEAAAEGIEKKLAEMARGAAGERVGVMLPEGLAAPEGTLAYAWGRWDAPKQLARRLYAGLRALDGEGCTVILCPLPGGEGIGAAMRDRLEKAASSC
jgi:L-threonylcarbamoyladenylate synthase